MNTNKSWEVEFDKGMNDGTLTWTDYGCDGSDQCCGNCGGIRISEDAVKSFIRKVEQSTYLKAAEAVKIIPTCGYCTDEKCTKSCEIRQEWKKGAVSKLTSLGISSDKKE